MSLAERLSPPLDAPRVSDAAPGDYLALLKPRVMSLVVFTALVGLVIAPGSLNPVVAGASLLAIAVGAGASGALNMWWDADIDAIMTRTRGRPIPMGRVSEGEALGFGLALSAGAVFTLGVVSNWLAAGLLAFTIFFYAVVYSMWLKRATPQNIVIGGAAGALPPVVGYAAATGDVALAPLVLFALIFIWTPPHFWALALLKEGDYGRAGIPMLPNVAGPESTRRHILAYSLLLAPLGVAPALLGFAGPAYAVVSVLAGAAFVVLALAVHRAQGETAQKGTARRLFAFSIIYLFVLFATLLAEHGVAGLARALA